MGARFPAKHGLTGFRRSFDHRALWRGRWYAHKEIEAHTVEEREGWPVITVISASRRKRDRLLAKAARHGVWNLRVFGSVARGEADAASDLDLLVDLEPGRSLIDLGALLVELEALLGTRVDVVTEAGLRPALRDRVLRDAVPL